MLMHDPWKIFKTAKVACKVTNQRVYNKINQDANNHYSHSEENILTNGDMLQQASIEPEHT